MFINYLLISLRNIKRNKLLSFINIVGLAIGIAVSILILLWGQNEMGFDMFHENADDIYRVISEIHMGDQIIQTPRAPTPLGSALKKEYPEIINFTRTQGVDDWPVSYGDKRFINDKIAFVDSSFFEIFSFPFVKGDPSTSFKERFSLVITGRMAKKYFGDDEPMGKIMKIYDRDFKVTGIIKEVPQNSHIMFDCAFPIINMAEFWEENFESWRTYRFYTYIQLQKGTPGKEVSQKISGIVKKHLQQPQINISLQPLKDVHLRSNFQADFDNYKQGDITYVYIFSLIAICILLIACINFMNLSTAQSGKRAKEIGMRKVIGAKRMTLIRQFFSESIIFSFIALVIAIILVYLFLPAFNQLSDQQLALNLFSPGSLTLILEFLLLTFLTGIIAGSYPALFLSSFRPVKVLTKIDGRGSKGGGFIRKSLVVVQFALTTILIIGTTVVYNQLGYMENEDTGFDKENMIYLPSIHQFTWNDDTKKREFLENPNVLGMTKSPPPTMVAPGTENVNWEGKQPQQKVLIHPVSVDYDYLKVFNLKMEEGRFFSKEFSTDPSNYILNEAAVKAMGLKSPVGKRFWLNGREGMIIGVIKNYHHGSLHIEIAPLAFELFQGDITHFSIKLAPNNIPETLKFLESKWDKFIKNHPFVYHFLDETIYNFYTPERRLGRIAQYCMFITIFISCLGLLGLTYHMTERRAKEIGIRKVFGASVSGIVHLLTKEFLKSVIIAVIIAIPIGWYIMNRWLLNFAYRIDLQWWVFLFAGGIALVIAIFTVSFQSIKAARTNPVESLRYE